MCGLVQLCINQSEDFTCARRRDRFNLDFRLIKKKKFKLFWGHKSLFGFIKHQ